MDEWFTILPGFDMVTAGEQLPGSHSSGATRDWFSRSDFAFSLCCLPSAMPCPPTPPGLEAAGMKICMC